MTEASFAWLCYTLAQITILGYAIALSSPLGIAFAAALIVCGVVLTVSHWSRA